MIREDIAAGRIGFDARLVDLEIAAGLKVSRMPVREALMQLRNEGVLESTSRGFVLKIYSPREIADIFEVRILLEPAAAAQACEHRDVAGLQAMEKALESIAATHAGNDPLGNLKSNWQFRSAWVRMVPNGQLADTMERLRDRAGQARLAMLHEKSFRLGTLQRAQAIHEAFVRGEPQRVSELIRENLLICRDAYCVKQAELLARL